MMKKALLISIAIHAILLYLLFNIKIDMGALKGQTAFKKDKGLYAYIPPVYIPPVPGSLAGKSINKKKPGATAVPLPGTKSRKGVAGASGSVASRQSIPGRKGISIPFNKNGKGTSGSSRKSMKFVDPSEIGRFLSKKNFNYKPRGGMATGGAVFESGSYDITPWAEKVIRRIRENWHPPLAVQLGIKGLTVVKIVVELDGRVSLLMIERPSGVQAYDEAAMAAVKNSTPFPPLPQDYPYSNLVGHLFFYYNLLR